MRYTLTYEKLLDLRYCPICTKACATGFADTKLCEGCGWVMLSNSGLLNFICAGITISQLSSNLKQHDEEFALKVNAMWGVIAAIKEVKPDPVTAMMAVVQPLPERGQERGHEVLYQPSTHKGTLAATDGSNCIMILGDPQESGLKHEALPSDQIAKMMKFSTQAEMAETFVLDLHVIREYADGWRFAAIQVPIEQGEGGAPMILELITEDEEGNGVTDPKERGLLITMPVTAKSVGKLTLLPALEERLSQEEMVTVRVSKEVHDQMLDADIKHTVVDENVDEIPY